MSGNRSCILGANLLVKHGLAALQLRMANESQQTMFVLSSPALRVGDLCRDMKLEREDFKSVTFYETENVKIAHSTPVNFLFKNDFYISINNTKFLVSVPVNLENDLNYGKEIHCFYDCAASLDNVVSSVQIEQQLFRLNGQLCALKELFEPMKREVEQAAKHAARKTKRLMWFGLGCLGAQGGVMARLTWWEYSWDVVEPITYFLGYCGVVIGYSYFLLTQQTYDYPNIMNRSMSFKILKMLNERNFDVATYEALQRDILLLQDQVDRLQRLKALKDGPPA